MSYDLFLMPKAGMTLEEVDSFLEASGNDSTSTNSSKEWMFPIRDFLQLEGMKFETIERENRVKLNFNTFQLILEAPYSALYVPFWNENRVPEIGNEVNQLIRYLLEFDFTIFDPQSDTVHSIPFDFHPFFLELQEEAMKNTKDTIQPLIETNHPFWTLN